MGRPLESKNKQKCCTNFSHCLTTQVEAQDEEHLERENQNVLAVINGVDAESDSENESAYDDSVLDKDFEMPADQCESQHNKHSSFSYIKHSSFLGSQEDSVRQSCFFSES
jgi:hypothetical protein